jgi:flagellar motor switch protein FliM
VSGQVLSADAIAALVDAAKEGRLPEEAKPSARRRRRMRPVDFSRPTKFTADQERRLKRAMEAFCRTAATRLSAELRVPIELEMIDASQLTWRDAHAQVPESSIAAIADASPIGTKLLLSSETNLVLGAIELLLGGATAKVAERRMTDIDWALARHFFDRILAQLSLIWEDMASVELSLDSLDAHLETAQLVAVSEPTLSITMEARLDGGSSTIALLLPWTSVAPVVEGFATREDATANRGADEARSVRRAVGRVDMTVRAEVASREMAIEDVLALQPGDVLRLNAPADGGITLFADKVPVHRAKPGRSGSRRAAQVSGRVGGPR